MDAIPVPGTVRHAGQQIALEVAVQLEFLRRLGKREKDIVHYVFGIADIIEQNRREPQKVVLILLINPAQGLPAAALELFAAHEHGHGSGNGQAIFHEPFVGLHPRPGCGEHGPTPQAGVVLDVVGDVEDAGRRPRFFFAQHIRTVHPVRPLRVLRDDLLAGE